jgi:MFS family permease
LELTMMVDSIFMRALILATWRGLSLTIFLFINRLKDVKKGRSFSYSFILSQKSFLFYFTPWIMFSLINSLSVPMQLTILGEALVESLLLVEYVLGGAFAIIGGFLSDFFGRKRMTITGFVLLGLGYAILGIFPENLVSWYFYTIVDGVAWGIFSTIFLITIWGDLAYGAPSEKYYALGGLPYLLSSFLQFILKPYIAETIPAYAIFSFTAFFLFLAVIPLMYAPETLPEKKIRERELRQYVDKAKKIKEKYA